MSKNKKLENRVKELEKQVKDLRKTLTYHIIVNDIKQAPTQSV